MTLKNTVVVAQLVRVLVCGAEGRGFEPHQPPRNFQKVKILTILAFFYAVKWLFAVFDNYNLFRYKKYSFFKTLLMSVLS